MKIVVATNNQGKLTELRALLPSNQTLLTLGDVDLGSPDETGDTFEANALIKARAAATTGFTAIADDSGLVVDALSGQPGVWSSRYAGGNATDADNNQKLLEALAEIPDEERTARFTSVVALVTPDGREFTATGSVEGRIGHVERGSGGFGYDPLLIVEDENAVEYCGRTMAELTLDEKNRVSHRARAYRALMDVLHDAGFKFDMTENGAETIER